MEEDELRSRFLGFCGPARFRKFAQSLFKRRDEPVEFDRLRYWQEVLWEQFLTACPDAPTDVNRIGAALHWCDVHQLQLVQGSGHQPVDLRRSDSFDSARGDIFPHGCGWSVYHCPACRAACEKWIADHPAECRMSQYGAHEAESGASHTSVALLRFTNPTDIPAYSGWDFAVLGADITLRAEDMRGVYAAYLEAHHRYFSNIPTHWPRYSEAQRIAELHAVLTEACETGRDVTLDGHDHVWAFASQLMFGLRFVSARCPECAVLFGPKECQVLEWSFGSGLAAEGGRRVVCRAGHTLYSCMEWIS